MEYAIGFIIAVFIALTGVGAGTITTPLLILKRSDDQQTALSQLMVDQYNTASPNFHKWLTPEQNKKLIDEVEKELEADREFALNSPMPEPHTAAEGVFCDESCHSIKPKYGIPKVAKRTAGKLKETEAAIHFR